MIKSLRDLTLTLARAKQYYDGTVLRVIPLRSPQIARARPNMPAIGERTWSERAFLGERGHVGASSGNLGRAEGYHAQYSSIIVQLCTREGKCQVAQTFDHGQ
jgi:hypothetical protein